MTLLLRAIVAASDTSTVVATDDALRAVVAGRVAAIATEHDGATGAGTDALLAHHAVIQSIFAAAPCLPARFGSVLVENALREQLVPREDELLSLLAQIGTRCELAITLAWRDLDTSSSLPVSSGREYLEQGLARTQALRRRAQRAKDLVTRLVAELAVERAFVRHETCPRPTVAVSMSVLVTRASISAVRRRIERLGDELPDVTTIIQGPWPPYTFAVKA